MKALPVSFAKGGTYARRVAVTVRFSLLVRSLLRMGLEVSDRGRVSGKVRCSVRPADTVKGPPDPLRIVVSDPSFTESIRDTSEMGIGPGLLRERGISILTSDSVKLREG